MADNTSKKELSYDTKAVNLGYHPAESNCYSMVPFIGLSTSFEQEDPAKHREFLYTRWQNPTRKYLETGLALLEDSKHCLCFASGTGAISTIVQLLKPGDHIVSAEVIYGGTFRYFDEIISRMNITVTYVDPTDAINVERALQDNTKLVFLESPSNPLLHVCDIAKISEIVHKRKDILLAVDNTFLTSFYQKPLSLGADIVAYSLTKYMNGHTDVCMGALCFNDDVLMTKLCSLQKDAGAVPSPFDCYLVLRGLRTLPLRMRQHMKNGLKVAQFLESHPLVIKVLHPWLPSHPQHEVAQRQSSGHSGMVSFYIEGGIKESCKLLKKLRLFKLGGSLGGVESLAEIPSIISHLHFPEEDRKRLGLTDNLVRLSIGIEDADDIIADLHQAFSSMEL